MQKDSKKAGWFLWLIRLLFCSTCEYCTNIACRQHDPGSHKSCKHHYDKAEKDSHTPFGNSIIPLDGNTGDHDDITFDSPLQRLWVKMGIKEKGKP